jgi:membrane carboxypeptidase/penicillin-binding protein
LEGAKSALPIWTEFMMKATKLYPPRDPDQMYFEAPSGIEFMKVDTQSLLLATPSCEHTLEEAFIVGTAPTALCPLHTPRISETIDRTVAEPAKEVGKGVGRVFGKIFGGLFGNNSDDKKQEH